MIPRRPHARKGERGFVLVVVLAALVMLALLGTEVTGTARLEDRQAGSLRTATVARTLAEGALHRTIFGLLTGRARADGVARPVDIGGARAMVTVTNENRRLNPNTAPEELLVALLRSLGTAPSDAQTLAASIVAWHGDGIAQTPDPALIQAYRAAGRAFGPTGRPFRSPDELALVIGMTPALLSALAPHLSVFAQGALVPDDPVIRHALTLAGIDAPAPDTTTPLDLAAVRIAVELRAPAGNAAITAVVRLEPGNPDSAALILSWNDHADPP